MHTKTKPGHDAFTFSLAGIRAVASYAVVPAIASDRIIQEQCDRHKPESDAGPEDDCDGGDRGWRSKLRLTGQAA